jgi:DNA repair ATPase RecN
MTDNDGGRLKADLDDARTEYQTAIEELKRIVTEHAADPNRGQVVQPASERLKEATQRYTVALEAYMNHRRKNRS